MHWFASQNVKKVDEKERSFHKEKNTTSLLVEVFDIPNQMQEKCSSKSVFSVKFEQSKVI